jgi:gluconate kinase
MMGAGNECSLGGAVIIVAAFRTTNYGETDIWRWVFKHGAAGAEGQSAKLAVCSSLPKRNKDVLRNCLP